MIVPIFGATPVDTAPAMVCGADSMYTRVPVYVGITVANRADTGAAPSLLLVAQAVATRLRTVLAGSPDALPQGDSLFYAPRRDSTPSRVWLGGIDSAGLRVVARRDGTVRWARVREAEGPLTTVLDRALADAKRDDEVFIPPAGFAADSMVFTLGYVAGYELIGDRFVARPAGPPTMIAFTTRMSRQKLAAAVPGTLKAFYPDEALTGRAEGVVIMRFVVDTAGQAVDSTIHDVWPSDRPRLTGDLGAHYEAFVRSATEAVRLARFTPAEVAGCRVQQMVQLPVTWKLARTRR